MIYFLILLNFAISWFNAWSVGRSWVETKVAGGFVRFMAWMGATMSAVGFTWSYVAVVGLIAHHFQLLPDEAIRQYLALGYLIIIIPALGSGLAITIQSWAHFWRQKSFLNGGVATWNTFAQVSNMYQAASGIPSAFKEVNGLFKSKDKDAAQGQLAILVVLLAIASAVAGILTTRAIILKTASEVAHETKSNMARAGAR